MVVPFLQKIGEHVSEDQLHEILSEVEVNKNAQVDIGEFLQVRYAWLYGRLHHDDVIAGDASRVQESYVSCFLENF